MEVLRGNIFWRGAFHSGSISSSHGLIDSIETLGPPADGDRYIVPGFVDIHIHGSCGHDFLSGGDSFAGVSHCLARNGVTSYMPTFAAAPRELMLSALESYAGAVHTGPDPFAIHLEGPFISPARKGAQNPGYMRSPDSAELDEYMSACGGRIGLVTVAPELQGAREFVAHCISAGVRCSIGHSDATYEQALESFGWGISIVNHAYNAMTPFHHRAPGVVGAMLNASGIYCELIADGIHVSPGAASLLAGRAGSDRIILITDGIIAQNGVDGRYDTDAFAFEVRGGVARLEDGTLAGSTLTMDGALRNMMSMTSLPLEEVLPMLTSVPCSAMGLEDRGRLEEGLRADITVLDSSRNVVQSYVRGERSFPA